MIPAGGAPWLPRLASPDGAPAVEVEDARWSYDELARRAGGVLALLATHGIGPGDRVAVRTGGHLATVLSLTAATAGGLVAVPVNPGSGERELEHLIRDANPRALLTVPGDPAHGFGSLPVLRIDPWQTPEHLLHVVPESDAPALILYTSGTTGMPKGAVLTRANLAANLDALARAWSWTEHDRLLHALPLFHVHGLVLGLLGTLRRGASLRWIPRFSVDAVAGALTDRTLFFGVPTMFHRFADAAESSPDVARALAAPRLLVSGSAGLPAREHARLLRATGRRVIERYGLTETLINTSVRPDDPPSAGRVGRALDNVELRLVDDERRTIEVMDDATLGEVAVRGPQVFSGYLHRPDATAAVRDAEGWFYTGDLAARDAHGSLRIVGRRATDLIKSGGYKIGAGEIEAALLEHPDVAEAAVVGEPDDDLGERVVAFVVPREGRSPGSAQLSEHVAALLAHHKRPRTVHLVPALPRNAMGKVVKSALRARNGNP